DSSMRTKPSIEEPSNTMSPSSALANWLAGTSTLLMTPVMSVNWSRRTRTFSERSRSSSSSFVAMRWLAPLWVVVGRGELGRAWLGRQALLRARLTATTVAPIVCVVDDDRITDAHRGCEPAAPQILHLRSDRRLGHEWDDWDGQPLPGDGIYHEPPGLFFRLLTAFFGAWALAVGAVLWLTAPRLAQVWAPLPRILTLGLAATIFVYAAW